MTHEWATTWDEIGRALVGIGRGLQEITGEDLISGRYLPPPLRLARTGFRPNAPRSRMRVPGGRIVRRVMR